MSFTILRVGFGLVPGDPFWVQVREAVEQRAQTLGMTPDPDQRTIHHSIQ